MAPPTLESIPRDVRLLIIEQLGGRRNLRSLCKVSKTLYQDTVPYLYRSLSVYAFENDLEAVFNPNLLAARDRRLFNYTREVKFWSYFHEVTSRRCMHLQQDDPSDQLNDDMEALAVEVECVLDGCTTGAIRSLDWDLGTCVPQSLLGPDGYFPLKHPNIETIRLVTDGECFWSDAPPNDHLALSAFPYLKRLSWEGISSPGDMDSLAEVLAQRSHQLEELELDFTYHRDRLYEQLAPDELEDTTYAGSLVTILSLPERGTGTFPKLKRLALSSAWLTPGDNGSEWWTQILKGIHDTFDFSVLNSLCLRECMGWAHLIKALTESSLPIRLKSLEIQVYIDEMEDGEHDIILSFLQSFQGLEEVFIYTRDRCSSLSLWRTLIHHRDTLVRFSHHQRSFDWIEGYERHMDSTNLSFDDPQGVDAESGNPLGQLGLTSLGLSCIPLFMRSFVSPFASKTSLQLLHMRQSGPDLEHYSRWILGANKYDPTFDPSGMNLPDGWRLELGKSFLDFAQWAFGPTGIRSLRLLAYGDFSHGLRFKPTLLRRREAPPGSEDDDLFLRFDELRVREDYGLWELWELYEQELHFLTACPTDTLMHVS